jgi:hypothetical protein
MKTIYKASKITLGFKLPGRVENFRGWDHS